MNKKLLLSIALAPVIATCVQAQVEYRVSNNFGTSGVGDVPKPTSQGYIYSIAQQSNGRIVASGTLWKPAGGPPDSAHLMRIKTNGTTDSTFGTSGIWGAQTGFFVEGIREIKMLSGDKFLAMAKTATGGLATGYVARYNADGSRDMSYNNGAATILSAAGANLYPTTMELQSDGKIIVGAQKYTASPQDSTYIFRFDANGVPDASFGTNGIYRMKNYFDYAGRTRSFRVVIDAQDRIYFPVVANNTQPSVMSIMRLTKNGAPDASYGTGGASATVTSANTYARFGVVLMPSGRIVAYGISSGTAPGLSLNSFRLLPSGQQDMTYGTAGLATVQTGPFMNDRPGIYAVNNGERLLMNFQVVESGVAHAVLMDIDTLGAPGTMFNGHDTLRALMLPVPITNSTDVANLGLKRMPDNAVYAYGAAGNNYGFIIKYSQTPTGIAQINNELEAATYPNPAGEMMTLRCAAGVSYAVYDMSGRELIRGITTGAETKLETSRFSAGMYTLVCTKGAQNRSLLFSKK